MYSTPFIRVCQVIIACMATCTCISVAAPSSVESAELPGVKIVEHVFNSGQQSKWLYPDNQKDMIMISSCAPDQKSLRNKHSGTIFLQEVATHLSKSSEIKFLTKCECIVTEVKRKAKELDYDQEPIFHGPMTLCAQIHI